MSPDERAALRKMAASPGCKVSGDVVLKMMDLIEAQQAALNECQRLTEAHSRPDAGPLGSGGARPDRIALAGARSERSRPPRQLRP